MCNNDIRQYAMERRVNLWEVSEALGYSHESALSRLLRHELPDEKKSQIKEIIDTIANKGR